MACPKNKQIITPNINWLIPGPTLRTNIVKECMGNGATLMAFFVWSGGQISYKPKTQATWQTRDTRKIIQNKTIHPVLLHGYLITGEN